MHHDKCCHMTSEAVGELTSLLQLLLVCTQMILSVVWAYNLEGEAQSAEFSTNRRGNWSCVRNGNQSMLFDIQRIVHLDIFL
jgi:hypothetical protein